MTEEKKKDPLDEFIEPDFEKLLCGVDASLVIRFFHYFSRFEHALKTLGFKRTDRRGYLVGADWDDFVDKHNIPYPSGSAKLDTSIDMLCSSPVKRQKSDLTWEKPAPLTVSFENALKQVPYIRNNLFHGGKYFKPEKKRDDALILSAIYLIQVCLDGFPDVLREFNNTGI